MKQQATGALTHLGLSHLDYQTQITGHTVDLICGLDVTERILLNLPLTRQPPCSTAQMKARYSLDNPKESDRSC